MEQTDKDILPDGVRAALEAEHGPIVAIAFRNEVFAFKRCTRVEFELRESRLERGDEEASERLLQERCVWPSRDSWNAFQEQLPLSAIMFWNAYSAAHGRGNYEQGSTESGELCFTSTAGKVFTFRRVTRPEAKWFQHTANSKDKGAGMLAALEGILRTCSPDSAAWLDDNLFAIAPLGQAFLKSQGLDLEGGGVVAK